MQVKFCPKCCIKTFRDKDSGNCEICEEQKDNDRKEALSETARFLMDLHETVRRSPHEA